MTHDDKVGFREYQFNVSVWWWVRLWVEKERERHLYLSAPKNLKLMTCSVLHEFMQRYLKHLPLL